MRVRYNVIKGIIRMYVIIFKVRGNQKVYFVVELLLDALWPLCELLVMLSCLGCFANGGWEISSALGPAPTSEEMTVWHLCMFVWDGLEGPPWYVSRRSASLTWWTIGTLMLTNIFTIYIYFSHAPAGVITTSFTLSYLPSNPLQPHPVVCASLWIITRILTLICWWFSWPYCHWNVSPLPKHSLTVALV